MRPKSRAERAARTAAGQTSLRLGLGLELSPSSRAKTSNHLAQKLGGANLPDRAANQAPMNGRIADRLGRRGWCGRQSSVRNSQASVGRAYPTGPSLRHRPIRGRAGASGNLARASLATANPNALLQARLCARDRERERSLHELIAVVLLSSWGFRAHGQHVALVLLPTDASTSEYAINSGLVIGAQLAAPVEPQTGSQADWLWV